jgi:Fe-S cluster assembly protein SufD
MNIPVDKTLAERAYALAGADIALPHRRLEDWRWTDLRQLIGDAYPPLPVAPASAPVSDAIARSPFGKSAGQRIVMIDGHLARERSVSSGAGLEIIDLASGVPAWAEYSYPDSDDPILAINRAFASGGIALRIAAGTYPEAIEVVHISTRGQPRTLSSRLIIRLEMGSCATLVETHLSSDSSHVSNSVTAAILDKDARLERVKLQAERERAIHLANFYAHLGERAALRDCTVTMGGKITRQQGFVTFSQEHADARISGAYLLRGKQHCDTRLLVDHRVASCTSRELFKCVVADEARGIFQGKVVVQRGAQKTDGKQSAHALLLSAAAEFDAKPELEIYADDVVCGHGATVGELDEEQLFYLRSRGIAPAIAKAMLVEAFIGEVLEGITNDKIRRAVGRHAAGWLGRLEGQP